MARPPIPSLRWLTVLGAIGVVCAIGGLLLPEWHGAQKNAELRAQSVDLGALNDAVAAYQRDHGGELPGRDGDGFREELLVRQLTFPTAFDGAIHERGVCGPYLKAGVPANPADDRTDIRIVTSVNLPAPDDTGGWMFHVPTGRFHANSR